MRAFIAIGLSDKTKQILSELQGQLKKTQADVKWVSIQNIHLTLKFLGDIEEKQLQDIKRIIYEVASENTAYSVKISSVGAFPKINFPRVIWAGIQEGDVQTKKIAQELEKKIEKIGIPKEDKAFSSHITIGRLRSGINKGRLAEELKNLESFFDNKDVSSPVEKITLYKSTLNPGGPVYEAIEEATLKIT